MPRVLLKLSGETLHSPGGFGVDGGGMALVADELVAVAKTPGMQLAVVVGGGNFMRGRFLKDDPHILPTTADSMGMLATVINAIALRDTLIGRGVPCVAFSAIEVGPVCDRFTQRAANQALNEGKVAIMGGGTGNPFFTTDTCAALRASELKCDMILKATQVDGVYSDDPRTNPKATKFKELTFAMALEKHLNVMDMSAFSMCMDQNVPIMVFKFSEPGNVLRAAKGEPVGTLVKKVL